VGFDTVWEVEHHFLNEFSHSSAPEVFLSAVAQRTKNIRIGHGVTLLPYPFNHPIRVAERIAALDIMSRGRVEWGTGRSSMFEQRPFGINYRESRAMWQEALEIIPRMWQEDPFSYDGRYFKIPPRSIIPKPVQKPHPPIWMAATSPESWLLAGKNGIGSLGFSFIMSLGEISERIAGYRQALKEARPVGAFINDRVGVFTIVHCAETNEKARENGAHEAAIWYTLFGIRNLFGDGSGREPQEGAPYQEFIDSNPLLKKATEGRLTADELDRQDSIIVGDPDKCVRKLERYRDLGLDRVLCLMQCGAIPHDRVMQSIRLFGKHVIPHIATIP
jgi:alkanesulfonate monooxygenase SsuD/methylene tetrahydromethanopterin reductase-like flavin-dependent oxidoreductase (luciferase family)